jgi:two-component system chemotaxis sensor kinase CheA
MSPAAQSVFVAEAREHLIDICTGLLQLEQAGEGSTRQKIEPLQRAVHSIKGGAGFFGLAALEQLAHRMETVFGGAMDGLYRCDGRFTDCLLQATDCLTVLMDDPVRGKDTDISAMLAKLDQLQTIPATVEDAAAGKPAADSAPEFDCEFELDELAAAGLPPLALIARINDHGRIVRGQLETADIDLSQAPPKPPFFWQIRVASPLGREAFLKALGLPDRQQTMDHLVLTAGGGQIEPVSTVPAAKNDSGRTGTANRSGTIRIPIDLIDQLMSLAGELVLVRNQARRYSEALQPLPGQVMQRLDAVTSAFQDTVLQARMQPVATVFNKYPRLIRDLSRQLAKQIELQIVGGEVELDKNILEALSDPLTHLIRNACDHGLESAAERIAQGKSAMGRIRLEARHLGDQILISFSDDGRGIDRQAVRNKTLAQGLRTSEELVRLDDRDLLGLILLPGFSTAAQISDISGRGVGMDVVKTNLAAIGGSIEIESQPGAGTTFLLRLPLTLAIIPTLLVMAGGERYALPQKDIEELVYVDPSRSGIAIERKTDGEVVRLRGALLPLVRLAETLQGSAADLAHRSPAPEVFAVVRSGSRRFGLVLDAILNNEEIVVKPLHSALKQLPMYSGATVLGDGRVALILNPDGIAQRARVRFHAEHSVTGQDKTADSGQSLSVLRVRQSDGRLLGIPMIDVLRIVMCHNETMERVGDQVYMMIGDLPTRILATLEGGMPAMPMTLLAPFFVVLLKHHHQQVGLAVAEVIGAEWIDATAIHWLETGSGTFRAAALNGEIVPLADPLALAAEVFPGSTREAAE